MQNLETKINNLWDNRDNIDFSNPEVKVHIDEVVKLIDSGQLRICEKNNIWQVNQWLKKTILLSFRSNQMALINGGPAIAW